MCDDRLEGGHDQGASLVAGTVRRSMGPWTLAVQALLAHLADRGFSGAPRPLGSDEQGREVVSYLPGTTVGSRLPWPSWVRSGHTLHQVARWLRDYHHAISDFTPPPGAVWREGGTWRPGQVVAHNDAAPYNAVWGRDGLVGFVDWDMAGPQTVEADLAWVAFAWVPLHARAVVAREGFSAFAERRARLETFLRAYGWSGSTGDLLETLAERLDQHLAAMRATARAGDATYQRMLTLGRDRDLETARRELADL